MMNKLIDSLLGPLGPEFCNYFYILMVISLVVLAAAVIGVVRRLLTDKKADIITLLVLLVQPLLVYFVNRLLYTMCVGSVKDDKMMM
jgi:hypothetical protein